jgi:hypothetical protein
VDVEGVKLFRFLLSSYNPLWICRNVQNYIFCDFVSREGKEIFLVSSVQTGSGARPASSPVDTVGSFCGGKAAGE